MATVTATLPAVFVSCMNRTPFLLSRARTVLGSSSTVRPSPPPMKTILVLSGIGDSLPSAAAPCIHMESPVVAGADRWPRSMTIADQVLGVAGGLAPGFPASEVCPLACYGHSSTAIWSASSTATSRDLGRQV